MNYRKAKGDECRCEGCRFAGKLKNIDRTSTIKRRWVTRCYTIHPPMIVSKRGTCDRAERKEKGDA